MRMLQPMRITANRDVAEVKNHTCIHKDGYEFIRKYGYGYVSSISEKADIETHADIHKYGCCKLCGYPQTRM